MKKNDTSERLLRLIEILQAKTDPEHLLTMPALISELEAYGIHSDRRSIYKQLHLLKESGYPIHYTRKGQGYYFAHPFNEAEVFLLMDAIQHIKALSNESTKELQKKIQKQFAMQAKSPIQARNLPKTTNHHVLRFINQLLRAIQYGYPASFQYYDLSIDQQKKYRRNRQKYTYVPYAIVSDNGWYYCVFYDEKHAQFITFRIDKMEQLSIEFTPSASHPFELDDFLRKSFHMYRGEAQTITIQFDASMANYVFDQFGKELIISKVNQNDFIANIRTAITPTLISWILQFESQLTILKPQELIDAVLDIANHIRRKYRHESKSNT
ncbi:MAG: WYL domain-containing protein [Solobacterium sp.]|nr:WYL domain-containing protein [Solobacterium sp.]